MAETLEKLSNEFAELIAKAGESTVRVEARRRLPATGFAWAEGIIVTANHAVEANEGIHIGLPDGSRIEAHLVGRDPNTDLAVLRAAHGLSPLPRTEDDLRVGGLIFAIGRPGDEVQTTLGVVSALGITHMGSGDDPRHRMMEDKMRRRAERMAERAARRGMRVPEFSFSMSGAGVMVEGAIQTDVVMYPGFSGGPLMDAAGFVRGLNTSAITRGNSLAVPVSTIQRVVDTLITHGRMRKGFLGVGAQPARLPEAIANERSQETGLLVVSVESGSPAESAGMLVGDLIIGLDEQAVHHLDELIALLSGDRVGKTVSAEIVRGGQLTHVDVTIAERI